MGGGEGGTSGCLLCGCGDRDRWLAMNGRGDGEVDVRRCGCADASINKQAGDWKQWRKAMAGWIEGGVRGWEGWMGGLKG